MMRKVTVSLPTLAGRSFSTAAPAQLVLNFTTPHTPIYAKKAVKGIQLPGAEGQYGVTAGHTPIISQLAPGVVTVIHTGGEVEKFFVSGGFALTHKDSTTDVSVAEAFPLADLDPAAIKAGHAEASKALASAPAGSAAKAKAQIEISTYVALARAASVQL